VGYFNCDPLLAWLFSHWRWDLIWNIPLAYLDLLLLLLFLQFLVYLATEMPVRAYSLVVLNLFGDGVERWFPMQLYKFAMSSICVYYSFSSYVSFVRPRRTVSPFVHALFMRYTNMLLISGYWWPYEFFILYLNNNMCALARSTPHLFSHDSKSRVWLCVN
jgi:hypothetical protein